MMSKRSGKNRFFQLTTLGLLAGCLWLSAGSAARAQDDNSGQQGTAPQAARTDADIQSDVGYALTHDATLQGQQVTSTAVQGTVTLSGSVQTNAQRQQAETIAANVSGVGGVLNNITVANADAQTAPSAPSAPSAPADASAPAPAAMSPIPPPPPPDLNGGSNQAAPPPAYNGARPPYQPQPRGYAPQQQGYDAPPPPPSGPVTIPSGTLLRARLSEMLDTKKVKSGTIFEATAAADIYQGGVLAIPRGAVLQGQVIESKNGGALGGSAELQLQLTGVNLQGKVFPLTTDVWSSKGPNKAGYTAGNTIGGAAVGALIGGIVGRGAGAAIGAGVGGAAGLAASSATNGPRLLLPPEAQVDFHLTAAVTVQPVSWQEAQRLASSVPAQPQLVRRPVYLAPRPYPYPYGYPYPY